MNRVSSRICTVVLGVLALGPATQPLGQTATVPMWKAFGLQGTSVRSLATAPDLLCAGTEAQGVYCRDLPGGAWMFEGLGGKTVMWLWVDPVRPDVRFAATNMSGEPLRLYRTLNGGVIWEPVGAGMAVSAVQGVPGTSTVYAAGARVWRSDDLGSTWIEKHGQGIQTSLEIDPKDSQVVWAGGETVIFAGYTILSQDGGATWKTVWDSHLIGDNQTSDISAHPLEDGLVLTGHEGFILRTNNGTTFRETLNAPVRFFIDWDGGNPARAYAGGSPNGGTAQVFVSRDQGSSWSPITGELAPRTVYRVEADHHRLGVAYVATDDGVYRFYGGGLPVCLDSRAGIDNLEISPGPCPLIPGSGPAVLGDAIAFDLDALRATTTFVDLGEVECLINDGDIGLATIDPPEPAPGHSLGILVRFTGSTDYGASSDGLPRTASFGDCP
jgi:hypothetical protein